MTREPSKLHQRFMDAVAETGIKGNVHPMPIFYSTPCGIRFEFGGSEEVYLPEGNGINPDYINNALIRAKTLYDNLPYKPDILRIDTYPNEEVTAQSVTIEALNDIGLPALSKHGTFCSVSFI